MGHNSQKYFSFTLTRIARFVSCSPLDKKSGEPRQGPEIKDHPNQLGGNPALRHISSGGRQIIAQSLPPERAKSRKRVPQAPRKKTCREDDSETTRKQPSQTHAQPWKSGASAPRQALLEKSGFSPRRCVVGKIETARFQPRHNFLDELIVQRQISLPCVEFYT